MVSRVAAAYDALPGPGDYEAVRKDIERQLPLRNLHWVRKNVAHRSIRTIQTLSVDFRPLTAFPDGGNGASLLSRPYLHLLFVVCDDNEVYRATIRSQIREWLDGVIAKQHQEWLIVHVTTGKGSGAKFYQRKSAIVDKIKADFNTGKKDRCIQVAQGASADDPTAWAEFSNKIKEGIIATFDSNVGLYEENVRKADSQRQLEGWHFLPFFLQKHNLAWFGNVGGLAPGDDALPLLLTDNKPYRKLIESNSISVFDFRIYLFARQAAMLFHLGRIVEVARRGAYFVSTFARKLREHQVRSHFHIPRQLASLTTPTSPSQNSLGQNFVESWTYSAALNIVEECEQRLNQDMPSATLDKIGMGAGHLPMVHPFSMSLNEIIPTSSSAMSAPNRPPVSRKDLLDAISKQEVFDKLYVDLTHRTIQAYQASGRKRCSIKLHAGLAALEYHRSRPTSAQKLFSQLPAHYADLRWVSIESFLLDQCTRLQSQLDMPKERLLSTLALVRAGIQFGSKKWELPALSDGGSGEEQRVQNAKLAKQLMEDVYQLSGTLSKDFAAVAFPTFSIRLAAGSGERATDEDGITTTALVRNLLPTTRFGSNSQHRKANKSGSLPAGRSCNQAKPPSRSSALYVFLPNSPLLFELILLSTDGFHRSPRPRTLATSLLAHHLPVLTPPHFVSQPRPRSSLGARHRQATLSLRSERLPSPADLDRTGASNRRGTTSCRERRRACRSREPQAFQRRQGRTSTCWRDRGPDSQGGLSGHAEPGPILTALVLGSSRSSPSTARSSARRFGGRCDALSPTSLVCLSPSTCKTTFEKTGDLLSKFSVTADGLQGLKVKSAVLRAPTSVQVKPCRSPSAPPVGISPLQTANFLFKLRCDRPADVSDTLRLVLTYSSYQAQLYARIRGFALSIIAASSLQAHARWLVEALQHEAMRAIDLDRYILSEDLSHLVFEEEGWSERVGRYTGVEEQREAILEAVRGIYEVRGRLGNYRSPERPVPVVEAWRTLEIPLDLPSLTVLNLVSVAPSVLRTELGQPVPATITIRSTFKWFRGGPQQEGGGDAGSGVGPVRLRLGYTVVAGSQEWVVSGRTRGEFEAEVRPLPLSLPPRSLPSSADPRPSHTPPHDAGFRPPVDSPHPRPAQGRRALPPVGRHHAHPLLVVVGRADVVRDAARHRRDDRRGAAHRRAELVRRADAEGRRRRRRRRRRSGREWSRRVNEPRTSERGIRRSSEPSTRGSTKS
ncbi:SPOSA6832_01657 [Sporobolomyces salmonicolor]|uniref:SPOSA6832_01657-mRNA-1:cds n=1 Tax=Sporidiobolus salmonicolor TaxID=5005 RepID=A0A0D6EJ53_SPOSA|nr:SPOSA6832_01657 [Sporobolomyces salmonicolor]